MTRPGAALCHGCHVVTPYAEMRQVTPPSGKRKWWVCAWCLDRRRKLRLDVKAGGKSNG